MVQERKLADLVWALFFKNNISNTDCLHLHNTFQNINLSISRMFKKLRISKKWKKIAQDYVFQNFDPIFCLINSNMFANAHLLEISESKKKWEFGWKNRVLFFCFLKIYIFFLYFLYIFKDFIYLYLHILYLGLGLFPLLKF